MLIIAFFFVRNFGKGCQPRPSWGAYLAIFNVNCRTDKTKTWFISNEFRVKLPDPICENPKGVNVRIREGGDGSIAVEDASWCRSQILFKRELIRQGIDRLILNLDSHPDFGCSTVLDELLVEVPSAVDPGSRNCLVVIGHGVGKRQIFDLAESSYCSADGMALLSIEIRNLLRTISWN